MQIDKPLCFAIQSLSDQINYLKIVNSSDFALRATTGQEGWGRFCQVVYPETARKAGGLQILCCSAGGGR